MVFSNLTVFTIIWIKRWSILVILAPSSHLIVLWRNRLSVKLWPTCVSVSIGHFRAEVGWTSVVIFVHSSFLVHLNFLHFVDWNCTFAVNPFALDNMPIFHLHDSWNTFNVIICDETKSPWLLSSLIFQNNTIFHHAKLWKISSKVTEC